MCRCADKQLTLELLAAAGLSTPAQIVHGDRKTPLTFLKSTSASS